MTIKSVNDSYNDFLDKVIVGISEVAEITGIPVRKLRYWESKGIIQTVDPEASSHQFNLGNIKKIVLIQELLDEGYTLDAAARKVVERTAKIKTLFDLIKL
ncbi:MAG: MerR family transcriptional regulator [Enterobacteriaceae bacterium]